MAGWLEQHEKQSELLGGAGDVLANSQSDPYLSQAVLDLQFGHSQRVGYDVTATNVLSQLQRIGDLHKRRPEHASLGVLRSPDIPSILVETGFISNTGLRRDCWVAMLFNSRSPRRFITGILRNAPAASAAISAARDGADCRAGSSDGTLLN